MTSRLHLIWKQAVLLTAGTVVFWWQLRDPVIRLAWPLANDLVGCALGFILPWLAVLAIFRMGRWWSKVIASVALLPLLYYSLVFFAISFITLSSYRDGRDLGFERVFEILWHGSRIGFYQTDGGATTDLGMVIRQERALVPGLLLVRRLGDFYPCRFLHGMSTERGVAVEDTADGCSDLSGRRIEYRLKPWVYF